MKVMALSTNMFPITLDDFPTVFNPFAKIEQINTSYQQNTLYTIYNKDKYTVKVIVISLRLHFFCSLLKQESNARIKVRETFKLFHLFSITFKCFVRIMLCQREVAEVFDVFSFVSVSLLLSPMSTFNVLFIIFIK